MSRDLLKTRMLSGGYRKQNVVHDIDLEIKEGELLGIIGPNGSGKTTLLRLMSRVLIPQSGNTLFLGNDIFRLSPKEFSKKVSFVAQDTLINFPFSVFEVVLLGRIPHLGRLATETKHDLEVARQSLEMTDCLALKEKNINELSAGERQRVMIAKALAQEPVLLFLDEPTSHLDIGHQIQVLDLLKTLNKKNNLTIAVVLHDLNLASEYCDRIILLAEGRIFRYGAAEEVLTYQNIEQVYKTVVVVQKNPITKKPFVLLVSKDKICRQN
ncbi:MAG: ABC transporter ATP-binding protein [Candidatus Omnitrophota bacterium]